MVVIVAAAGFFGHANQNNQKKNENINNNTKIAACVQFCCVVAFIWLNCLIAHQYSARTSFAHIRVPKIMGKIVLILGNIDSNNNNDF